jgi:hypothetical protein
MPIANIGGGARLSGTVTPSGSPGKLAAPMTLTGREGLLEGTVSRAAIESVDGPSILYAWHIRLAGEWIPREHLLGPLEIEEGIDTHVTLFRFGLIGAQYSVTATTRTWTRTPVEVWTTTSRPGALPQMESKLIAAHLPSPGGPGVRLGEGPGVRASGYVLTCSQSDAREPVVRVSCADDAVLYDRWQLCFEVPPGAGLTRGEICAEALRDAGVPAWDIPAGAVYQKPVQAISTKLFDFLKAFGEPEGWSWRFRPEDRVLEASTVRLRQDPEPPDHVWTPADFVSRDTTPPKDVPSRWIVRGTAMVLSDELGITTRLTRTVVEELYAPKVCGEMQLPDGSVAPTGLAEEPEAQRITTLLEDEQRERGGRIVQQITREWGWFNPAAGKLRAPGAGEPAGPVAEGFYPTQAWIDPDGEPRAWPREAFVQIGERRQTPTYDAAGTPIRTRTDRYAWHRKSMGVRSAQSATLNVIGAAVGGDDQSWYVFEVTLTAVQRIEDFGLAQVDDVRHEYDPVTGAARREVQESFGYRSPRTAVQGVPWYVLYDGTGQQDLVAPWGLRRRQTVLNLLAEDGHLLGKIETTAGYGAPKKVDGAYDWGDFKSNHPSESFRTLKRVNTQYNLIDQDHYEEIVEDEDGRRTPRLITGRLPLPRFQTSPWTQLLQQPFEEVLDDATAEAWWGFSRQVIDSEYVQSLAEARALVLRRRARLLAHQHQVTRPSTLARPGDTVLLVDPRAGIHARCLVTHLRETWDLAPRTQVLATYTLEQPL